MMSFIDGAMLAASDSLVVSIIVKTTLILVFALVGVRLARRSRASMRHAILAAAFGVLLVLPVVSALAPPFRIVLPVTSRRIELTPLFVGIDTAPPVVTPHPGASAPIPRSYGLPVSTFSFVVWLAGTGLLLWPVIMGLWQIRFLRRSGLPWPGGQSVAEGLTPDAGIHRRIEVLLHESLAGPMTGGVLHPTIVFPADAPDWHEEDLERAMVHELEHVRRRDWIWHCLARAVCSLYWFHPLVWIAWRQLTVDAERACDDAVLGRSEATAYAGQLVGLARRMLMARKSPVLAMANRSDLSTRVGAVLDGRQQRGRGGAPLVAFTCAAAAVLVVAISPLRMIAAPQANSSPSPRNVQKFEVASVRLENPHDPRSTAEYTNNPQFRNTTTVFPSNRLTIRHTGLQSLISDAFGIQYQYILGGPDWLARQHYDLDAKVEGSALLTREQMRPLLRNLLEERFHLKARLDRKIVPGYALVIAKGGPRLQPNKGAPFLGIQGGYTIKWQNVSLEGFARALEHPVKQPVIDKTGIKGMYDFDLKYGPHGLASEDPVFANIPESAYANLPDIFTVLQEKLGLKLVPEKVTIDTLVIDHIDKVPTEN
jgi:uncharacterized protein (TIGR03435 family)